MQGIRDTYPMTLDRGMDLVGNDLKQVERLLREGMRSISPLIPEVGEHTFGSGGKRIRPMLVLLAARLCGYRGPRSIQVASATECLHSATLMHDDVVDGALTRRGRPSVNARYGIGVAILVGDFLLARASQTIVEDGNPDLLWRFAETIRTMAEGEVLQLTRSFDPELPESVYLEVIGRKTSSLLALCTEAGAILGGVTRAERRAVREFGWELGLAFQLVDDALDYTGYGAELGKAALQDLSEGKLTLPLIQTLKRCSVSERESVATTLKGFARDRHDGDPSAHRSEIEEINQLVRRYRGAETTLERASECARGAAAKIEPFADCEARRVLIDLAEFVVRRRS